MVTRRLALGVATGVVLAGALLVACKQEESCTGCTEDVDTVNVDTSTVGQHLYLKSPDGTKFEIGIGKDANGKYVVKATRSN